MYIPKDRYVWDFWVVPHEGQYHLFHLQGPRDLPDPELRHGLASVGHAVSKDLVHWENLGTVLGPGQPGEWDDRAIWTGSVVKGDGLFYMFYTGTCRAEEGRIQRIGFATSRDLVHWDKYPGNPVLEVDLTIYEKAEDSRFGELAWRDPYVIRWGGRYLALVTARRNRGDPQRRGCIATASSEDLRRWRVGPPLEVPGGFAQMEVPQLVLQEGRAYLLFSVEAGWVAEGVSPKATGTFYAVAPQPFDRYSPPTALLADHGGSFYAAKLVHTYQGDWVALAWLRTPAGDFVGGLSDPFPVRFNPSGAIEVG